MTELWHEIPGYEGLYEVSNQGNVRSLDRIIHTSKGSRKYKSKLLTGTPTGPRGYLAVRLSWPKRQKFYIHVLVATVFHGARPKDMDCCHCNGNLLDNRASNLRWDTRLGNMLDTKNHGTIAKGERQGCSKITEQNVLEIRAATGTCIEIGKKFSISPMQVSRIKRKQRWAWL
jgi:hypothetical protein